MDMGDIMASCTNATKTIGRNATKKQKGPSPSQTAGSATKEIGVLRSMMMVTPQGVTAT